ncbi:hypothetical protein [Spirosoma montaniterrae]|uniref:Lipocalin-like domain-containing protein n=1 Tax=Spirosoma montaniterrae TaxID=1178516 RepID=A0A1P9X4R3_9BACT|nr:hypothetical protein [Spirosoma montaniterrae]AQG82595.1 hypothetical protein AWR27_19645 [Spirosoma montaniterrae]
MKTNTLFTFLAATLIFGLLTGCRGKKVAPVSERIAKVWTAQKVDENNTTVYTRGAASNVRNYATFRLDLSKPPTVEYTEFDGNKFTGQYSVPSDSRLVLSSLNPAPTGTNGTIEFTISDLGDNSVKLTRTTASQKTGNTTNIYTLSNP